VRQANLPLAGPILTAALILMLVVVPNGAGLSAASSSVEVVQTSADQSSALTRMPDLQFSSARPQGVPIVSVDDSSAYQRVDGFGGTMTDTSAWLLEQQLPASKTLEVMKALFGPSGIGLNFLRVPMGASDFTKDRTPYSYDDMPRGRRDPHLKHFSVAHDLPYVIPSLRQALSLNPHMELLANPWSPPGWMKTNDNLNNHRHRGVLRPSSYGPLANYFVKFLVAYGQLGIPISEVTPQNEPGNSTLYPGLQVDGAGEIKLIRRFLAPAFRHAHLRTAIYGGDVALSSERVRGGRDRKGFVKALLRSPARRSISGIAWHCYFGNPPVINAVHRLAPRVRQIGDECAPGVSPLPMPEVLISELRNWARVVTFFNLAEDTHHGPVQPPNHGCPGCTGLVTIDEASQSLSYHLNYFQMGQASEFIKPHARRIRSGHFVTYHFVFHHPPQVSSGLDDVAVKNPDGSKVLLTYNTSSRPTTFGVQWKQRWFTYTLAPGTTATFVWDRPAGAAAVR
jgi:glucosylceramidase